MWRGNLVSLLLFALLKWHMGDALTCHVCVGECKREEMSTKVCGSGEVCMIREMYADGVRQGQQKGCLNAQMCNNTTAVETFKQYCCNTDMCNTEIPQPGGAVPPVYNNPSSSELLCYSCGFFCINKQSVKCAPGEMCLTRHSGLIDKLIPIRAYGCGNSSICEKDTEETVGVERTTVKNRCCNTNLCNTSAAATLRPPLMAAIGALLALWMVMLS